MSIEDLQAVIVQDLADLREAQDAEERALVAVNPLTAQRNAANARWNHDVMALEQLIGSDATHEWLGTIIRAYMTAQGEGNVWEEASTRAAN